MVPDQGGETIIATHGWKAHIHCHCLVFIVTLLLSAGISWGAERVTAVESNVRILDDGRVMVRETIRVAGNGTQIVYGICRDLDTAYRDRYWLSHTSECSVRGVTMDGNQCDYRVYNRRYGARIYLGTDGVRVPPGEHVYTLDYELVSPLRRLGDRMELRWNAWGYYHPFFQDSPWSRKSGWPSSAGPGFGYRLPVERAVVDVTFPAGARGTVCRLDTALGRSRVRTHSVARQAHYTLEWTSGVYDGLDIPIDYTASWSSDHARDVLLGDSLRRTLNDNLALVVALIGLVALILYVMVVRLYWARHAARGEVVALPSEPDDMSPAGMRYRYRGRVDKYDRKALAASLAHMAIGGALTIEERSGVLSLTKNGNGANPVFADERKLLEVLFRKGDRLEIDEERCNDVSRAVNASIRVLTRAAQDGASKRKPMSMAIASAVCGIAVVASAIAAYRDWGGGALFILFVGGICGVFLVDHARNVLRACHSPRAGRLLRTRLSDSCAYLLLAAFIMGVIVGVLPQFVEPKSFSALFLFPILGMQWVMSQYCGVLETAGGGVLEKIASLRRCLSDRGGEALRPSMELFEGYLPYALALDVECDWARLVTDAGGFRPPDWYVSESTPARDAATLVAVLSGPLVEALDSVCDES